MTTNRNHFKSNGAEKVAYNSMRLAQEQARNIERKQGDRMTAYQCAECHLWHVGHTDSSGMAARVNEETLSTQQKDIGYVVKPVPSLPMRPAPAPTNQFTEAAAKLHRISQEITTKEAEINRKTNESKRLAELAMTLFNQAAEHESQGKALASEAQTLSASVAEMKGEAQGMLQEISRPFVNTVGAA